MKDHEEVREEGCDLCDEGIYEGADLEITTSELDSWEAISTRTGVGDPRGVCYARIRNGHILQIELPIYDGDAGLVVEWEVRHCPLCGRDLAD